MAKKAGRPSLYTPELIDELCERLSKGEPMAQICRDDHMPAVPTINKWRLENPDINSRVAQARDEGFDAIAQDCLNIADDNGKDTRITDKGVEVTDHDVIQRAKLRVETRLKLLACWDPKRYGNKVDLTSNGNSLPAPTIMLNVDPEAQ